MLLMLSTIWFSVPLNEVGVELMMLTEGEAKLKMTVKTEAKQANVDALNLLSCSVSILYSLQRSQRAILTVSLKQPFTIN